MGVCDIRAQICEQVVGKVIAVVSGYATDETRSNEQRNLFSDHHFGI